MMHFYDLNIQFKNLPVSTTTVVVFKIHIQSYKLFFPHYINNFCTINNNVMRILNYMTIKKT